MKNQLIDLNNHLFAQMERLSDEDLTPDELKNEVNRSKAMSGIARDIISNADLALRAAKYKSEEGLVGKNSMPAMLGDKS
jgi:hypothetical protein